MPAKDRSKQVAFVVADDVWEFLENSANKTQTLNQALRLLKAQEQSAKSRLDEIEERLSKVETLLDGNGGSPRKQDTRQIFDPIWAHNAAGGESWTGEYIGGQDDDDGMRMIYGLKLDNGRVVYFAAATLEDSLKDKKIQCGERITITFLGLKKAGINAEYVDYKVERVAR